MSRRRFDFYETPPHYVDALARVIGVPAGTLIEPCVGKGAIIDLLKVNGVWHTNDIDKRRNAHTHFDATSGKQWRLQRAFGRIDWGITNPPFKFVLPILRHMLKWCDNVAILGRLSLLEPTIERRLFWTRWARGCEVIVLPRYSFKGNRRHDMATCAWYVWRKFDLADSDTRRRQLYVSNRRAEKV